MENEQIQKIINANPDSITIGSASKGGAIKVFGDFTKPEEFKKRIDGAKETLEYARANIGVNI